MATLWVKNGYQKEFERKINSYTSKLDEIDGQYSSAGQLISAYAGDGNVNTSNVYLKKRRSAIQTAIDSVNTLKQTADKYVSGVVNADITISNSIHSESYTFYKKKGIGPQQDTWYSKVCYSIKTTASDFWHDATSVKDRIVQDVKDFYEEYKYLFNVLGDILMFAAAIALFAVSGGTFLGVICFIGAVWATTKALYELATDCMAVGAWLQGDEGKAEDLANRTLTEQMIKAGEWLDKKTGKNFFETSIKVLVVGLEFCQFVATVMLVFDSFKDIFNLKARADGKPLTTLDHTYKASWKESVRNWRMTSWSGTKGNGARFASTTNWIKFGAWMLKFSFKKDATSFTDFAISFIGDAQKNSERMKSVASDPSSALKNIPGIKEGINFGETIANIIMA